MEEMDKKHHELHQKNKAKHHAKKAKKVKEEKAKVEATLTQKKTAEKVGEQYGKPNPKPSKYEKKLRSIFTEMQECNYVALKNLENHNEVLTQNQKGEAVAEKASKELTEDQMFKLVKHPDQKKYMHYAL
jgi:hypothetical protein